MLVTGVQAVGAKSVASVQGAVVDLRETSRLGIEADRDTDRSTSRRLKAGGSQPVVFPREGVGVDKRPVSLRQHHAAARYRADGGDRHA
jgi:hypothetical protein